MDNYLIFDIETGLNSNPFIDKGQNKIVCAGYKTERRHFNVYYTDSGFDHLPHGLGVSQIATNALQYDIVVGHNITYDLLHVWHIDKVQDWFRCGGRIWDTQLAEYLLSGQQTKMCALRDIAIKYGCKQREKLMEKYWEQGIDTWDIPDKIVREDVMNDVLDTEQVYLKQVQKAKQQNMYELICCHMEGLCATIEMRSNGFKVNEEELKRNKQKLQEQYDLKVKRFLEISGRYWK